MNRHAKASSAGSASASATSTGTGTASAGARLALVSILALILTVALSGQASAVPTFGFKEAFGSAAHPTFAEPTGLAIDRSSGNLLVMDRGSGTISRFKPDGTPVDFSALGTNVIDGAGGPDKTPQEGLTLPQANEAQIAIDSSGTITDGNIYVTASVAPQSPRVIDIFAGSGAYLGQLTERPSGPFSEACGGVTVDPGGSVYIASFTGIDKFSPTANPPTNADYVTTFTFGEFGLGNPCTAAAGVGPTEGYLFPAVQNNAVFKMNATTGILEYKISEERTNTDFDRTTTETVAPGSGHVVAAYGKEVVEYDASGASQAVRLHSFTVDSPLKGVAADSSGDVYVSREGASELEIWGLVPYPTVTAGAATNVTLSGASLNGTVNPEGVALTGCKFEYGFTASFEEEAPCSPSGAAIPPDLSDHSVNAAITGLQANTTYKFRLTASNANGSATSKTGSFTTHGPPQVTEVRALNASQSAATIEGKVNPSGFGTSYRFEWGPTESYGNQIPADFEPFIGSSEPIRVTAKLSGLSTSTNYHYRIVATSSAGTTASPDQIVETLNSCGLPDGRCFELVSRREAGPVAIPGETVAPTETHYQAATDGPGGLAYVVEAGYPESTKGAEVLYRGTRGASGWDSTQLSTPLIAPNEQINPQSTTGPIQWLSDDLSCGFAESYQPLTDDPSMNLARESGGSNLYRINPDGSYTGVTYLAPENPERSGLPIHYEVAGGSQDCGKVLFKSEYRYPGIPGFGQTRLYEWDEGILRNVGVVPGPSGEVTVEAVAGAGGVVSNLANTQNTVSEDGSRVFFSANRQTSPNPAEIGTKGIFVREDGTTSRDLSLSETSTPDKGAKYQWATPDGSKVFFTANAGLTDESSSEGTDLYVYDLESEELTDLTPYNGAGGAQVDSFIGASEDGSHVYFASRNQLVPGRGSTLAENQSAKTLSIYDASNGEFSFVGTFSEKSGEYRRVVLAYQSYWTSRVSPDGRYLLFISSRNLTDYDSDGRWEAYLYDAQGGSERTICISCPQGGQQTVAPLDYDVLAATDATNNPPNGPQFLTMRGGEPQVFFSSPDKLAPGAVEHQNNIYEWSHGQVFRLVSAREGQQSPQPAGGSFALFAGASTDGSDAYLVTPETLNWEDGDERLSVYDARIGGGFPEPPAPPAPCVATTEGSCQGPVQGVPSIPGAASAAFNGPGNPAPAGEKKQKKSKKKSHKKKGHTKKKRANDNRRAGK